MYKFLQFYVESAILLSTGMKSKSILIKVHLKSLVQTFQPIRLIRLQWFNIHEYMTVV